MTKGKKRGLIVLAARSLIEQCRVLKMLKTELSSCPRYDLWPSEVFHLAPTNYLNSAKHF